MTVENAKKGSTAVAMPSKEIPQEKPGCVRYLVLVSTMLCLTSLMSNVVCFNFTVLCMPGSAIGAVCGVIPVIIGISRIGLKAVFFASGILTAVSTFLIPILAPLHFYLFVILRFAQGLSYATCFPAVGAITSTWASLAQQGLFIAALTTFGQTSSIFSMPVAGELCTSPFGWKAVFYLHALISVAVFTIWFAIFTDSPEDNKLVRPAELAEIEFNKSEEAIHEHHTTPYLEIASTPSVWGIWIGAFGDLIAVQLIHIYSPVFLHDVGGYSFEKTGFAAAVPVLFQFLVKMFAGHSSDKIHGISETTKLRIYNSIALGASAVFLVALGFVKQGQGVLGLVLMTLATGMFGFNGGGFSKCSALVSRQYNHFVMAIHQILICFSMIVCPLIVSSILQQGTVAEWRIVFFVHAAILLVCNAIFCWLATAKPAPWTDRTIKHSATKNTPLYQAKV
uniref:MFS domain-containing protein n=1 Tax=Caenorhabditis tropicalis TaxID=1561998 RepID=A0A1I7V3Z3_9PELO